MACSHTRSCPLFPLISVNSALKVWKTFYCEGNYQGCARYELSRSGQSVPANLLPNGKTLSTTGMASEVQKSPEDKVKAVEQAAPQIVEEMSSIKLDLDLDASAAVDEPASQPAPVAVEEFAATGDTSSWYVRIMFNIDTGVVANVIQALGHHGVKIDAMSEKRVSGPQVAMILIIVTDQVTEEKLNDALVELKGMGSVVGPIKKIELEYLSVDSFK